MRFKCICVAITILFLVSTGFSQECPKVKNEKGGSAISSGQKSE